MESMFRGYVAVSLLYTVLATTRPSWTHTSLDLRQMIFSEDKEHLYVIGEASAYQLRSADLAHVATYSNPDSKLTVAFNIEPEFITICNNGTECAVHQTSNISEIIQGNTHLKIDTAKAATLLINDTLFIACPHTNTSELSSPDRQDVCEAPGITWKKYNKNNKSFRDYNPPGKYIKMREEDAPIKTEEYLAALSVRKYRLFFSRQRVVSSGRQTTRIAHLCQQNGGLNVMGFTYVDMEMHCGEDDMLMTDVTTFDNKRHVIAVFSSPVRKVSTICIYPFTEIIRKFVVNYNDCYRNGKVYPDDYFGMNRCNGNPFYDAEETNLCDGFEAYFNVIGNNSLDGTPVLEFNKSIQAIVVVEKNSELIAFLGTADNGQILKAVVYPASNVRKIPMDTSMGHGKTVRKDMYISANKKAILAMTNNKVERLPVQQCSVVQGCNACLHGKDPYCGWCVLKNRCTIARECGEAWINATLSNSTCPSLLHISSPYIPADHSVMLDIKLSHLPGNKNVTCRFHSSGILTNFSSEVEAHVNQGESKSIQCQSPNINSIADHIQGTLIMRVSILTNMSTEPFVEGHVTYYSCETFTGCSQCIQKEWECDWCIYEERCEKMNSNSNCSGTQKVSHTEINGTGNCPIVSNVEISAKTNKSGIYFLSAESHYTVKMTGANFPEPKDNMSFTCHVPMIADAVFHALYRNDTLVECFINKTKLSQGQEEPELHLKWGSHQVIGSTLQVTFYDCKRLVNSCAKCKSFAEYGSLFECHWCGYDCISTEHSCSLTSICPPPTISKVSPISAVVNASTLVTVIGINLGSHYNETINAVTIGGLQCRSIEAMYIAAESITCELEASSVEMKAEVNITLLNKEPVLYTTKKFMVTVPQILGIFPTMGPQSGGTLVTISGQYLNSGYERTVYLGGKHCSTSGTSRQVENGNLICITAKQATLQDEPLTVMVKYENSTMIEGDNITYSYIEDPVVMSVTPKTSFLQGGRGLTVMGTNLHSIQISLIYATFGNGQESDKSQCTPHSETEIYCKSPMGIGAQKDDGNLQRTKRDIAERPMESAKLSFVMDGVSSVKELPEEISTHFYYRNPVIHEFSSPEQFHDILVIRGERLAVAADQTDVKVLVGTVDCNVISLKNDSIYCNPPEFSAVKTSENSIYPLRVHIGYFHSYAGLMQYATPTSEDDNVTTIVAGVCGFFLFVLVIVLCLLWRTCKKRQAARKEKQGLEYRLDKLEATFRTQCREEFAELQTAVSDLTSDLEGGHVLFRDYHVYACKTLFSTSRSQHTIMSQCPELTSTSLQALDNFKALLKNTNFLLMFIRTLEKEKNFSIQDKSHVATILTVLNHDNLEFITEILKTLLNDLVDKNIAAQTPKLMLRRSESVSEKLLTHWLSVCLYHYLKDCSGSALYILYKAIKTQVEKGPVDYITGCGKYTLSEERLFTSADTAVNVKTLILQVTHFNYIDNEEKQISATVLDCDTITQAKAKMLEILYKNVSYSQRPPVHKTMLQIQEEDGTERTLNDEDASSVKEGLWKKINTLLHYGITDGIKANLVHSKETGMGSYTLAEASPDAYIVGSYRKSRPAVRTISGSNYWHLTKQNIGEDEVKISSDFSLPRLLTTKGTLQTYIDDLFAAILTCGNEPPVIIKYLYDFLDAAAQRHGITDPDVLHTWKCNSVLLRFWVNILKNPEFVFDIHKPQIVDACLSVVAQTLMDSCSTADLQLGRHSPSNKLLFAKDIPRYKKMVKGFFEEIKNKPPISDQDFNSYLTERVSQKFSGSFNITSALLEMYKYATQYKEVLMNEMDNMEAASPGSFFPLSSKLEAVFACMELNQQDTT